MLDLFRKQLLKLENQVRFILAVIKKEIKVNNRKKDELFKELEAQGYDKFENDDKKKKKSKEDVQKGGKEEKGTSESKKKNGAGYGYLLSMPIWNLTMERVRYWHCLKERSSFIYIYIIYCTKTHCVGRAMCLILFLFFTRNN